MDAYHIIVILIVSLLIADFIKPFVLKWLRKGKTKVEQPFYRLKCHTCKTEEHIACIDLEISDFDGNCPQCGKEVDKTFYWKKIGYK